MKKRLVILTDLFGLQNADWLYAYSLYLQDRYQVQVYDTQELAELPSSLIKEKEVHDYFVEQGIEKAVENLLKQEKESFSILAFSIGGTIAWKASLQSSLIEKMTLVSSTRIRFEANSPTIPFTLYFGEQDSFRPSQEWVEKQDKSNKTAIIPSQKHTMYQLPEIAKTILEEF